MGTSESDDSRRTVLELDLACYSDISRVLEENLDVYATKAFQDQIQSFVDQGLQQVGLKREDVVLGTAGDNALLVFDDATTMHKFAEAMQQSVAAHNCERTVDSAKRCFRMGAATGKVLLLPAEKRIVGTTVARAVRLEAAAKIGQIVIDTPTYDLLSDSCKAAYGVEEMIRGKRQEQFAARRCEFVPMDEALRTQTPAQLTPQSNHHRKKWLLTGGVAMALLLAVIVMKLLSQSEPVPPIDTGGSTHLRGGSEGRLMVHEQMAQQGLDLELWRKDRDRALAQWVVLIGGRVKTSRMESWALTQDELPKDSFRLTHVDFGSGGHLIADAELARFSGTRIIDLCLKGTEVTDHGLASIADLQLVSLNAEDVRGITDVAAERIGQMRDVGYLYLSGTEISDKGLVHFEQLRSLQELRVRKTRVTREGVDRLKAIYRDRGQRCIHDDDWSTQR